MGRWKVGARGQAGVAACGAEASRPAAGQSRREVVAAALLRHVVLANNGASRSTLSVNRPNRMDRGVVVGKRLRPKSNKLLDARPGSLPEDRRYKSTRSISPIHCSR